ncbi:hypothetical protein E6P09_07980 [Haloferax mediterranei ATCC 33500]|uniref:Uncharacterized protein n=1 Tax=Haloferax mediterranei (strain ATCC 33500 / DSM 1411 / JCM 8866 / NBRC 14739 / NCIMB 2177 / R-4) TaxID=523841 RepID=I3R395_HALMT|nr:hypothetical protein [Haloferax mediterranei]AFK18705.1 hypothetical protein HFX_0987 [Haloferax mediterranei ATCC 33500]AHZ21925.1 hypothetical protein BM92_04275 [Haloferax mediterranei ATCC 33500]EMA03434.1 hypothetical protein C439_05530 [Haloferax mediterranei ATCC 33500]MDX5988802.1 hypothetical protein [Haloferax mediterranei ATCC 33500]QCQ75205.1 hypothetical protein E6P09_07980 [Haloferax mediterranei ATCC 33500]
MELESQLLPESRAESFVRACRTTAGDDLRSVTYFTHDRCEQVYLRSDLEADADLAGFVEHETDGFQARTAYRGSELGDYQYTIRAFEHGYLTRVTVANKGVFVTTDGLTLRRSKELASALSELLDSK